MRIIAATRLARPPIFLCRTAAVVAARELLRDAGLGDAKIHAYDDLDEVGRILFAAL